MKQAEFLTTCCKLIAENKIRGAARELIMQIAVNGYCRPVWKVSQAYSDHTDKVLDILKSIGIQQQGTCVNGVNIRRGYLVKNDAPRGGKIGTVIQVNFDDITFHAPGIEKHVITARKKVDEKSYIVGNWRFFELENGELHCKYERGHIHFYSADEDFSKVITEAAKHGFNVDAEFLQVQAEHVLAGYKVHRFLPDRSGAVFSPIRDNGIIFRFAKITENMQEYIS